MVKDRTERKQRADKKLRQTGEERSWIDIQTRNLLVLEEELTTLEKV